MNSDDRDDEEVIAEYYAPDTVCAVAADHDSLDLLYFIYIVNSDVADVDMTDGCKHDIKAGQEYISGYYLEKRSETLKGITYTVNEKKSIFFYKESIVYPFVNAEEKPDKKKKTLYISNNDYCDILRFVEETKMAVLT